MTHIILQALDETIKYCKADRDSTTDAGGRRNLNHVVIGMQDAREIVRQALTSVGQVEAENKLLKAKIQAATVYIEEAGLSPRAAFLITGQVTEDDIAWALSQSVGHLPTANQIDLADHEPNPLPDRVEWRGSILFYNNHEIGYVFRSERGYRWALMGDENSTAHDAWEDACKALETEAFQWLNLPIPHKEG